MHFGGSESYSLNGINASVLALMMVLVPTSAFAAGELALPDWNQVFDTTSRNNKQSSRFDSAVNGLRGLSGTYQAGVLETLVVEDNLSDGIATDMSVRIGAASMAEDFIYNDTVSAAHDLGNAYVLAEADWGGDLQIYVGVELLSASADAMPSTSFVELELTQNFVQAVAVNAPLKGDRSDGDLLVRINFTAGQLESVEIHEWISARGYEVVESARIDANSCHNHAMPYLVCLGEPPRLAAHERPEVWDLDGVPLQVTEPDRFLELGLDVASLVGSNPEFSSIVLRTYEDISIDSFQALGHWGLINVFSGQIESGIRAESSE